jgi:hypothetical protein
LPNIKNCWCLFLPSEMMIADIATDCWLILWVDLEKIPGRVQATIETSNGFQFAWTCHIVLFLFLSSFTKHQAERKIQPRNLWFFEGF